MKAKNNLVKYEPDPITKRFDVTVLEHNGIFMPVVNSVEHGVRSIICTSDIIDQVLYFINEESETEEKDDTKPTITPIIDYPLGLSSTDIRTYSLISLRQKSLKDFIIPIQYGFGRTGSFKTLEKDVEEILKVANEISANVNLAINPNWKFMEDNHFVDNLNKILSFYKVKGITFIPDRVINFADIVLVIRGIKDKIRIKTDLLVPSVVDNAEDIQGFFRAGIDTIGVDWKKVSSVLGSYRDLSEKSV